MDCVPTLRNNTSILFGRTCGWAVAFVSLLKGCIGQKKSMNESNIDERKPTAAWPTLATDQSLLRRFRAGSQDAATALYLRYAERLNRLAEREVSADLARRLDSDDIVQSVFRTFFRRAAGGQYEVADREDLWKLLLVMALNKIRTNGSFHRAAKRSASKTISMDGEVAPQDLPKNQQEAFQVLKLTVEEVVASLPEEHRDIVWARIEGLEFDEIVHKTGRAKRTVERILQGFRQKLMSSLGWET